MLTPTGGENSYQSEGISLIRSQNVYDFCFLNDGLAFIDDNQVYELRNVEISENDILINITGESVTRYCVVLKQYLPARVNQHVSIIPPIKDKVDYRCVFYFLKSRKPELPSMAEIGCTRRALTKVMLEKQGFGYVCGLDIVTDVGATGRSPLHQNQDPDKNP